MLPMRRILPAVIWLVAIYVVTVLSEGFDPPPTELWARVLFELKHVAAHSFVFGVQTILIFTGLRWGVRPSNLSLAPLVALIIVLGLGQETLQSLLRHQVTIPGSAFDLATDGTAALLTARFLWFHPGRLSPYSLREL